MTASDADRLHSGLIKSFVSTMPRLDGAWIELRTGYAAAACPATQLPASTDYGSTVIGAATAGRSRSAPSATPSRPAPISPGSRHRSSEWPFYASMGFRQVESYDIFDRAEDAALDGEEEVAA